MEKLIITTKDELELIVQTSVKKALKEQLTITQPEEDQWFNIESCSQFLGLAVQTVYQKVSSLDIPYHKRGGKLWFLKSELDQWLKEGRQRTRKEIERDIKEGRF